MHAKTPPPPRRRRRLRLLCCGPYLQRRYASPTEIHTYLRISYGDTRRRCISQTEIRAVLQCCMRRSAGGGAVASSQALRIRACSEPAPGRQAAIGRPASRFGRTWNSRADSEAPNLKAGLTALALSKPKPSLTRSFTVTGAVKVARRRWRRRRNPNQSESRASPFKLIP